MLAFLETVAIGLVSGVLSGLFGIGGGIVTTPAIRLILDAPALVAVGTPLIAIIPSTITGARAYVRNGLADVRSGVLLGGAGAVTAVAGAWFTRIVGGSVVLIATAVLILYVAVDMIVQAFRPPRVVPGTAEEADAVAGPGRVGQGAEATEGTGASASMPSPKVPQLLMSGAVAGFYSGFLGLGGGFVLVPLLTRWLHFPLKRAIGTSLVSIAILSIPGAIAHARLGNIDWGIALGLVVGVIPGAAIGAHVAVGSSDKVLRIGFATLLTVVGLWLAFTELTGVLA